MGIWVVCIFQLLWIIFVWTLMFKFLCWHRFSFSQIYTLEWKDEMGCTTLPWGLPYFSTSSQVVVFCVSVCFTYHYTYPRMCKVVFHCGFDLLFPNSSHCWLSFHVYLSGIHLSSLKKCLFRLLPTFLVGWILFVVSGFCILCTVILHTSPRSDLWFVNIFCNPLDCRFTFLMWLLCVFILKTKIIQITLDARFCG